MSKYDEEWSSPEELSEISRVERQSSDDADTNQKECLDRADPSYLAWRLVMQEVGFVESLINAECIHQPSVRVSAVSV